MPYSLEEVKKKMRFSGTSELPPTTESISLEDISGNEEPKNGGIFSSLVRGAGTVAKGFADIALQPARFIEQAGKGIGMAGVGFGARIRKDILGKGEMSEEEQARARARTEEMLGPGLQEQAAQLLGGEEGAKEYATPSYETANQYIGGGLKAAANLATPLVGGVGKLALQGAAMAGGGALEEGKPLSEVALSTVAGGALGAGGGVLMKGLGKAMSGSSKKLVEYLGKKGRGLTDAEVGTIKTVPDIVKAYYNKLKGVGDDLVQQQKARQEIEGEIFDSARDAWNVYTKKAGEKYSADMLAHGASLKPGVPPFSKESLMDDIMMIAESRGASASNVRGKIKFETGATDADRAVFQKLMNKVRAAKGDKGSGVEDLGWKELDMLRKDIGLLYETVDAASPEKGILDSFYSGVKQKMMSLSKDPDAVQATFDAYKNFITEKGAFKKLTSNKTDPIAMRQGYLEISRALSGQKGSSELASAMGEALKAGGMKADDLAYRLQALELANRLTGTRSAGTAGAMASNVLEETFTKIPTGLTGLILGAGRGITKAIVDDRFMENLFEAAGVSSDRALRKQIGQLLQSPKAAALLATLSQAIQNNVSRPNASDTSQE